METTSRTPSRAARNSFAVWAMVVAVGCTRPPAPRIGEAARPSDRAGRAAGSKVTGSEGTAALPGEKEYREFKDDAVGNWKTDSGLDLTFVDGDGKAVDLRPYRGKKNVVLVMTRGFAGMVCPYCTAQTSRLSANIDEFARRDAQILVVWPGPTDRVPDFVQAVQAQMTQKKPIPFPLWLDENFKAVDTLGIRGELARPSTYIIDKAGKVRFGYVGATLTDRPSVKSMLSQLDKIVLSEAGN